MNLRKLARGKPCMIRLPGCNHDRSTTVLAHYRLAGYAGTGTKPDDFAFGSWSCSACHDLVDGRVKTEHSRDVLRLAHAEGCLRTQAELRKLKQEGKI
jgi:hypothetical protein